MHTTAPDLHPRVKPLPHNLRFAESPNMTDDNEIRLRELVAKGRSDGLSIAEIAAMVGCHVRTVSKIIAATKLAISGDDAVQGDHASILEALQFEACLLYTSDAADDATGV
jgi:hypothetical protein